MIKRFYSVTRYEADTSKYHNADNIVESLHTQIFVNPSEAVKWILGYAKNDLAEIFGDEKSEKILESYIKGNFTIPKGLEVLVLPCGGGDRAVIETTDKGIYYRIERVYVSVADSQ